MPHPNLDYSPNSPSLILLSPWVTYKQRNATSIPTTRAPIEPAATCDEPLAGGADVEAGGAGEDGALELLVAVVIVGVSTSELLLDGGNELVEVGTKVGVEVTTGGSSDVVSGGGGGAADVVSVGDGDGDGGGGGGALPVGVTWICPSVYSLTGT